jgi:hypothetical protein
MIKRILISIFCVIISIAALCQEASHKKFHSFKIKGGFRIKVAGRYFDNDTIPVYELIKNPILEIQGYKDSIKIVSYDVVMNWRGITTTFTTSGEYFSPEAIKGLHQFLVDSPITIQNIKCRTSSGVLPIIKTLKLIVFVPHQYIVTGYSTYTENMHFWDISGYKGPVVTHSSRLGIIILGDTITPKDTANKNRYIRLSGKQGLGSIVINLDSISAKDSIKHLPSLEIWGSFYGDPRIFGFYMNINMNTHCTSNTNRFTKSMAIALSKCKPGTTVWITQVMYTRGILGMQLQDFKFTVARFTDVNN